MNELTITVVGWAATDVRTIVGKGDLSVASFRLASTPRYYDRERSRWVDGVTEWFTVRAFRSAAVTLGRSIRKGMPVVVTGRMRTSTWESKDGPRVDHVIDATAVGPDCLKGVAGFIRATGDDSLTDGDASPGTQAIQADRMAEEAQAAAAQAARETAGTGHETAGTAGEAPEPADPFGGVPEEAEPPDEAEEVAALG